MKFPTKEYLGRHTTISYLTESDWKKIPYLSENNGGLPPFVIAVGDARRIKRACEILELKNIIKLHEEGEKLIGRKGRGRVDTILGLYTYKDRTIPIMIVETQMGMASTEIILREVLAHCSPTYSVGKQTIDAKGIYVIRAGTAGGINSENKDQEKVVLGDMINASFNIGWTGTILESEGGLDYPSGRTNKLFRKRWLEKGHIFTDDNVFPRTINSHVLVDAINNASKELGLRAIEGGNFSKDSLYAEIDIDAFVELRTKYNVMSTEMEQMIIAKLASDFKASGIEVHAGLVSGIIGVLPSASFESGCEHEAAIKKVEEDTLRVAANALWNVSF